MEKLKKPLKRDSGARNWCFTLNNPTEDEFKDLFRYDIINYIVIGHEYCPKTNTPHLQGYVQFKNKMRLITIKNKFNERGHFEKQKGTVEEAINYCKKDGNFYEDGNINKSGVKKCDMVRCVWQVLVTRNLVYLKFL